MKKPLLIALLTLTAGCSPGFYVFGDSLTSPWYGWHSYVNTHVLQVMAVPGLRLAEFDLPTWIKPTPEIRGVILFIGTNDAGSGVPVEDFADKLDRTIQKALSQGLEVVCVEIPEWPTLPHTGRPFDAYRAVQAAYCPIMFHVELTPEVMADSPDGLHWGPDGQKVIAEQIIPQLEEL